MKRALLLSVCLMTLVGCGGGATIDASSQAAFDASIERLSKDLEPQKAMEFQASIVMVMLSSVDVTDLMSASSPDAMQEKLQKELHGLTVDEVIAKAKSLK